MTHTQSEKEITLQQVFYQNKQLYNFSDLPQEVYFLFTLHSRCTSASGFCLLSILHNSRQEKQNVAISILSPKVPQKATHTTQTPIYQLIKQIVYLDLTSKRREYFYSTCVQMEKRNRIFGNVPKTFTGPLTQPAIRIKRNRLAGLWF